MSYDFIIIGSGSAGGILAARLSEDPTVSVLLIESGPLHHSISNMPNAVKYGFGSDRNLRGYWYSNPADGHMFVARATDMQSPMLVPRGTTLGGSSSVNAQIFLRGEPDDYDSWASEGNNLWGFQECLPYFRILENDLDCSGDFHGKSGPVQCVRCPREEWHQDQIAFFQGFTKLGFPETFDHNDPDSSGVGPLPFNTIDRIRQSTWLTYVKPVLERKNLTVLSETQVQSVKFSGSKATSVRANSPDGIKEISAGEIILSAGAIGSPQILMLSGVGPAAHLEQLGIDVMHDLPGVGLNLRDHPQVPLYWKVQSSYEVDQTVRSLQVALRYTATGSKLRNDMLIHPVSYESGNPTDKVYFGKESDDELYVGMVAAIYLAKGSGSLKLRTSDSSVQPFLDYNFLCEEQDLLRLRESIRLCITVGEGEAYKGLLEERVMPSSKDLESDGKLDQWLKQNVRTSHHISGTCKMNPSTDELAVVNQLGQVHGLSNLRVADASIMNDCVRANTNVPTMMIGERISDLIKHH